jgi:hypothetical protein
MKTGQTVDELGLYSTDCCSTELMFDVDDTFSRCPKCLHLCLWEFEYEHVTPAGLDRIDETAA